MALLGEVDFLETETFPGPRVGYLTGAENPETPASKLIYCIVNRGRCNGLEIPRIIHDVDVLACFKMGHDVWSREHCIASLQRLWKDFPDARRFFLGDAVRILINQGQFSKNAVTERELMCFALGCEFGHALIGTFLPAMEFWKGAFAEGRVAFYSATSHRDTTVVSHLWA